jgi:tRNA nucleotidyltransferase (CCA-adding enzyme)
MSKINSKFNYPKELEKIFKKLKDNNIKPIIVGGYVRDFLLNIKSTDIDVELYNISSFKKLENILKEFGDVNSVGKCFGVCKLSLKNMVIDFTLPRTDNKISNGHCGFEIIIDKNMNFKTASSRRDFTINSIGYDVIDKKILDPFDGCIDLENKILKAVDLTKFAQDPLRVLRAIGFCSRFNFVMENKLCKLCKKMCDEDILNELAKERIYIEIKKIFLKSNKLSYGFELLKELNALKYLSPLDKLEQNSFKEILTALNKAKGLQTNNKQTKLVLLLAVSCYKFNIQQTKYFILNLTNSKNLLKKILPLKENKFIKEYSDSQLFELATKVDIEFFLLYNEAINPSYKKEIFNIIKNRAIALNILNKKAIPFLQGRDILAYGIKPSKEYSKILNLAYEAQINLEIKNHKEAILWLKSFLS